MAQIMDPNKKYPALYDSKEGRKECILSACFLAFSCVAVGFRLWARALQRRKLAFNDYACIAALIGASGMTSIIYTSVYWAGSGHHVLDINPIYLSRIYVVFAAGQPVWGAANTAVKFSILHLYTTIFPSRTFRTWCHVVMGISLCYFTSVMLETFLLCKPVAYNWDKTIPTGTCDKNSNIAYIVAGTTNVIIDIIVVIMPMPMLWQLHMPFGKKMGVIAMFSLGGGICIISILRVIYVAKMDLTDFAFASVDLAIWSVLEPTLGIVNACLPVLRPVVARLMDSPAFDWARSTLRSATKSSSQGTDLSYDKKKSNWKGIVSTNKSDDKNFKKIRDPYALDTVNLVGNDPREDVELSNRSRSDIETGRDGTGYGYKTADGDIKVTTDWTVDVERASRRG